MGFFRQSPEFDLGEMSIENMFITEFMPSASGTYVKVYLLSLLFSKEENRKFRYDNQMIASMLSLPIQDVHEAWVYWEKVGLIKRHFHEDQVHYDVEFISLRSLYIQNNYTNKTIASQNRNRVADKTQDNPFKLENEAFQTLIKSVEKIMGHPLTYVEHREINDFFENYTRNADLILRAFSYCYIDRKIRNIKTVKSTLLSWIEIGLNSVEDVNRYIQESSLRYGIYKEVLKLLGITFRQPNTSERDLIDKWMDEYAIEANDLFEIIKDLSKKTLNINFNYLDKNFESMHSKNSHTFADYVKEQSERAIKPENKDSKENKPQSRRKNYTIEKEKTYTDEELEQILLNKRK